MNIDIREMTLEDVDGVLEVEKNSFTTPWSKESFIMEVTRNKLARYLVVSLDGSIVGYAGFWLIVGEAHITNIAVHSDYRGRGFGNLLLEGLIRLAKKLNCGSMTLEVRESNIVAQNLYKKYGFVEAGVRSNYYADVGEDAIIMWNTFES